jgi:hypothetical protein
MSVEPITHIAVRDRRSIGSSARTATAKPSSCRRSTALEVNSPRSRP